MRAGESEHEVRAAARAYEAGLPADQRKRLGQFFTGMPLGRLLAHLALSPDMRTVLDPMAGHGDLLDATAEAAKVRRIRLEALDGIEVDEPTAAACSTRLQCVIGRGPPQQTIIAGDAFDPRSVTALGEHGYDLVITNPPYVRYQAQALNGHAADTTRVGVKAIIAARLTSHEQEIFAALAEGYSGLADLSVPAWLLTAAVVRPGGRLALVVPATWRSRDYADVIRYLMLRCFVVECVVEDRQPGWFSDALVRTHLIVARHLTPAETATPLHSRTSWPSAPWLEIAERASDQESLVGAAFESANPELDFAAWVSGGCAAPKRGIHVREFKLEEEWGSLDARAKRHRWYQKLERDRELPLFSSSAGPSLSAMPNALQDLLPDGFDARELVTLQEAGSKSGRGYGQDAINSFT